MLRAAGARVRTETAGTPVTIHGELPATRVTVEPAERLEPGEISVPGDFSSAAFFIVAALLVARQRGAARGRRHQPGRIGLLGILTRMGAAVEVIETGTAGGEPVATIVARSGPLQGDQGRRRGGAAGDRRAAAGRALGVLRRGRDGRSRAPRSCATRSRTGSRPWSRGSRGLGADDRGDRRRLRGRRRRRLARRHARRRRRSPAGDARRGRRPRLGARASRSAGSTPPAVSYPGFERDLGSLLASR